MKSPMRCWSVGVVDEPEAPVQDVGVAMEKELTHSQFGKEKIMKDVSCFNCRFYSPEEYGSPIYEFETLINEPEEGREGICRFNPPVLGELLTDHRGEEFRHYGEWPKTRAGQWCGRFERRDEPVNKTPVAANHEADKECQSHKNVTVGRRLKKTN